MSATTFEAESGYGLRRFLGRVVPYTLLVISIIPIVIGYAWVIIATFSERTQGLMPVDREGNFGGLTLENWAFVLEPEIWQVALNTLWIAVAMVVGVGFVASLAGYALSRMNFAGRKGFLGMTLILHAFRPEMLLIAIFMVLLFIKQSIPVRMPPMRLE